MKTRLILITGLLGVAIVASSLSVFFVSQNKSNSMMKSPEYDNYDKDWKKVDSLVGMGLPKSALEQVEMIYNKALKENNHPQFIKSVIYKVKLKSDFQEEFMETSIKDIEMVILKSETPVRQILHSIEADLYWRFYQANRYKFLDRTTAVNTDKNDIRTWDLKTLIDAVIKNYNASLQDKEILKKTNLKDFDPILETQKDSKKYRPTLYDFLAFQALEFFSNDESSVIQPAFRFELDKENYFSAPSDFKDIFFETKDTLSLKFFAIKIFQDLISFHQKDSDPTALIDADLMRLDFVRDNSILEIKDSLYLNALLRMEKQYSNQPAVAAAGYKIAQEYSRTGNLYNPKDSGKYRWDKKKAIDKCKSVIEKFPGTDGAQNCKALQQQIELPNLQLTMQNVNVLDKPFLVLADYKNTKQIWFKIIQPEYKDDRNLRAEYQNIRDLVNKYNSYPTLKSWTINLPDEGDMQNHRTEIKIPALPMGYYVVLASTTEKFLPEKTLTAFDSFWISNISYISQGNNKGGYKFYMLGRETGEPLEKVIVQMFYRNYDYRSRKYEYQEGGSFITDPNGYFEIPPLTKGNGQSNSFSLEFKYKGDMLVSGDQYYHSGFFPPEEQKETRTWFFTDRSIYRPGQTIYFKGIVIDKFKEEFSIKSGHKTIVEFMDVNYQKISEMVLTTNEYGSFSGTFTTPTGVLNGSMTIKNESGSVSVQVEEYKRPTFEVTFNPLKGSYKLNEIVTVTGTVKAYSGNAIDNGSVKYRVVRHTYFPWRYYWFDYFPSQPQMEIVQGTTITDQDGNFNVQFDAIPDHSVAEKYQPSFRYVVYADVTDINGETQSESTSVEVSNIALKVDLGLSETIERSELKQIKVKTTNLNGQPEPASGKIIISSIKEPSRLLRKRLWEMPDVAVIPKEEFVKDFPYDIYLDESDPEKLETEAVVATLNFDTKNDSILKLDNVQNWKQGKYLVNVETKDSFGQDVKSKTYFTLCSKEETKHPANEINWFHIIKGKGEPGEKASFLIGTKEKSVRVLYEVIQKEKIIQKQWITLNNEQKLIEIPITEELRGGFSVNLFFVRHNRYFENKFNVEVPFTNKQLEFEFETFRNKLTPGQKEEWKVKIKGHKGEKVAAELLASMYDASLDALLDHSWQFALFNQLYGHLSWDGSPSFATGRSNNYTPSFDFTQPVFKEYDRLNWFGFNYYGGGFYYRETLKGAMDSRNTMMLPGQVEMDKSEAIQEGKIVEGVATGGIPSSPPEKPAEKFTGMQVRRDFRETAFFYPSLKTNEAGDVEIVFDVPESLTKWKLMGLSHAKDLSYGSFEKEIITQKELMVMPNTPRFFREGDKMFFSVKIVNLYEGNLSGSADLKFFDARTMKDITELLIQVKLPTNFNVSKGSSQVLNWEIAIPEDVGVIMYQVKAKSGNFSDGEEKAIPVLKNRMLVTETLPLPLKGNQTRTFKFDKLLNSAKSSKTLKSHNFTLEFSSNPAWYAVQALPYIMESEVESADNVFERYYANAIASFLVNSNPRIKSVFDVWKNYSPDALLSNLEKNQELKSAILNETPWVMDARNETERKQRVGLLFDLNRMSDELASSLRKLQQKQSPNGAWPWFNGMPESRYITQDIVTGFGHLQNMGISDINKNPEVWNMVRNAIYYLDERIKEDYDWLIKNDADINLNHLGYMQIQYLYARSYFLSRLQLNENYQVAFDFYMEQAKKYWKENNKYAQGMIALALNRLGDVSTPTRIIASIREYALYSDEMGMYWRDNLGGYYWHEAPVETQALLIEAFDEVAKDKNEVEQMKIWLLKQKQTQNWKTPKATAEAVYALLLKGSDWLVYDELAEIKIGKEVVNPFERDDTKVEAGTGYFKTSWSGGDIKPEMGNITVTNKNEGIAWGAVYWQYFEDLDKITPQATPLKLDKKLFIERNTDAGPIIEPLLEGMKLKVGDKVKVRIELRSDRDMEYIHMKDMRAAGFEPVNVISGYRYQGGLGYYESTLDASTNFFFEYLRKGTYVFEYAIKVSQKGNFSNGITTIQCMYAPEFSSHSEGVRVAIE